MVESDCWFVGGEDVLGAVLGFVGLVGHTLAPLLDAVVAVGFETVHGLEGRVSRVSDRMPVRG